MDTFLAATLNDMMKSNSESCAAGFPAAVNVVHIRTEVDPAGAVIAAGRNVAAPSALERDFKQPCLRKYLEPQ